MNFSGSITEANGMTTTRLIERIVEMDRPGRIELKDEPSGRKASIVIRRGMIEDVSFNDQHGDPALTAIGQSCPWDFEFIADSGESDIGWSSSIKPRAPKARARAVVRPAPLADTGAAAQTSPAVTAVAAVAAESKKDTNPSIEVPATAPRAPSMKTTAIPTMVRLDPIKHEAIFKRWTEDSEEHRLQFGWTGRKFLGSAIHEDDHAYFRDDFSYLRGMAGKLTQTLSMEAPSIFAISEEERSTGYRVEGEGFLGVLSGEGSGVDQVILFGDGLTSKPPGTRDLLDLFFAAPEIVGMLYHRAESLIHSRMPTTMGEEKAPALALALASFYRSYAAAERNLYEVFIQSGPHGILSISNMETGDDASYLTIILNGRGSAGQIIPHAREWLTSQLPATGANP